MQKESDIANDLAELYSVVYKGRLLGEILGNPPTAEARLSRAIRGQSSQFGKIDSVISQKERESIDARIEKIRNWVMTHGEWQQEEGREYYSSTADTIQIAVDAAEKIESSGFSGFYLHLYTDDEQPDSAEIVFFVDFQKKYSLDITFGHSLFDYKSPDFAIDFNNLDPKPLHDMYSSGEHNLKDMDSREFRIISFYLNRFIQAKQIE